MMIAARFSGQFAISVWLSSDGAFDQVRAAVRSEGFGNLSPSSSAANSTSPSHASMA